ncbi:MAG: hypothetical protein A49_22470 [Methyloceanibacter sp.]|nr:MAG: hypothetical protein A49_22470 [Methyloceanibacter sp.]
MALDTPATDGPRAADIAHAANSVQLATDAIPTFERSFLNLGNMACS